MRSTANRLALATLLACLAAPRAQDWEKINPPNDVAIDFLVVDANDIVSVFGGGGTWWSSDAGKHWTGGSSLTNPVTMKVAGGDVTGMDRDGSIQCDGNGDLYVVQAYMITKPSVKLGKSLFKSTDHGSNWTSVVDSLDGIGWAIPTSLRIAADGNMYMLYSTLGAAMNTLQISKDKGKTWTKTGDLIIYGQFTSDPDGVLWAEGGKAKVAYQTLYRSKDKGASWDSVFRLGTGAHGIDAGIKGGVAVTLDAMNVAAMLPGESSVKVTDAQSGAGFALACALTPGGGVVIGAQWMGVKISDKGMTAFSSINGGLGKDTSKVTRALKYDSKGNLYMHAAQDLWIRRGNGAAIRPMASMRPRTAETRNAYDLKGRRLASRRAAWRAWVPYLR